MADHKSINEKLAFTKYLVEIAKNQAVKKAPFLSAAILSIHDALDIFLQAAHAHLGFTTPTGNYYLPQYALKSENLPDSPT